MAPKPTCKKDYTKDGKPGKCALPQGHKGNHGPRPVKVRAALNFAQLTATKITDKHTMAEFRPTRGVRDPEQKYVDGLVDAAYLAWVEQGKPADWTDQHGLHLRVPEEQLETLRWRVTRAGIFYELKIRFGDVKHVTDDEGNKYAEVIFTAIDRPAGEAPESGEDDDDEGDEGDEGDESGEDDGESGEDVTLDDFAEPEVDGDGIAPDLAEASA